MIPITYSHLEFRRMFYGRNVDRRRFKLELYINKTAYAILQA